MLYEGGGEEIDKLCHAVLGKKGGICRDSPCCKKDEGGTTGKQGAVLYVQGSVPKCEASLYWAARGAKAGTGTCTICKHTFKSGVHLQVHDTKCAWNQHCPGSQPACR
eukprot:1160383-Pelagomonas_calceolata.AAC.10